MALLFCDGFDHYATADIPLKWNDNASGFSSIGAGGRNSNAVLLSGGGGGYTKRTCPNASGDTVIVGFAYKPTNLGWDRLFRIDTLNAINAFMLVQSTGRLNVVFPGGTMMSTTAPLILNTWVYLELKVVIANAGSATLRANGEVIGTFSGDTQAGATATWDQVGFGQSGVGEAGGYIDDFYVCDGTGATNNDFLGDIRVQSILPSGAGNTTQMTPSAGSNYACVDEAAPNGDTDYVSETTAGEKDTYAFGNLTSTSGTIKGVQVLINARKDDAGSRSIAPVYRPVSTDYDGTTVSVSDSYAYLREITEVSPATSAAWTIAEINGAEFGVTLKA